MPNTRGDRSSLQSVHIPPVPSLRALTAVPMAALISIAASPVTVALAAGTSTVKDPYGENTALGLDKVDKTGAAEAPGAPGGAMAKTILGLGVVIAVIYGLTWVLRQMKASQEKGNFGGLSAEASVALGPGRAVHLIRAGRELVLVGSAEHGVVPIRTYSEAEALELGLIEHDDDDDQPFGTRVRRPSVAGALGPALDKLRERTAR